MNDALAGAAGALIGILAGGYTVCKSGRSALAEQKRRAERAEAYFHTLNQWLMIKNRGINIEQFFIDNHYYHYNQFFVKNEKRRNLLAPTREVMDTL